MMVPQVSAAARMLLPEEGLASCDTCGHQATHRF